MKCEDVTEEDFDQNQATLCNKCNEVKFSKEGMIEHIENNHRRRFNEVKELVPLGMNNNETTNKPLVLDKSSVLKNLPFVKYLEKIKCPECGNWGAYGTKVLKCPSCGNRFERKEGSYMDGVFLNDTPLSDRYEEYIEEGCKRLELSEEVKDTAKKLLSEMPSTSRQGRSPRTMSGGAVYLSAIGHGERVSQQEVSKEFNVSTVAIRKNYQKIVEETDCDLFMLLKEEE